MAEWKDHMKVILLGQVNLKVNIKQLFRCYLRGE